MNFADSEIVNSILIEEGMTTTQTAESADVILVNTCSIRENAETKVWNRLKEFRHLKKANSDITVGVLGCMAERIKDQIIEEEQLVDIVVGPDAYRDIPRLLAEVDDGDLRILGVDLNFVEGVGRHGACSFDSSKIHDFGVLCHFSGQHSNWHNLVQYINVTGIRIHSLEQFDGMV